MTPLPTQPESSRGAACAPDAGAANGGGAPILAAKLAAQRWPRRPRRTCRMLRVPAVGVLTALLALQQPSPAHASIFGEDTAVLGAILGENIAQVAQLVQTVVKLQTQIEQFQRMIVMSSTMLQTVKDPQSLLRLLRHTQALLRKKDGIERNVRLLHYKLEQIDKDREEVFPELEHMPTHEFQGRAKKWNAALKESSTVAMRAQTSVAGLQERLEISTKLQRDSEAAEGIVGQLQLIVKSLALLHTDLSAIEQNLAYGQRVTATMAGVQAAEQERMTEESSRMLENYRYRGTEPRRLHALP